MASFNPELCGGLANDATFGATIFIRAMAAFRVPINDAPHEFLKR